MKFLMGNKIQDNKKILKSGDRLWTMLKVCSTYLDRASAPENQTQYTLYLECKRALKSWKELRK